MFAFGAICWTSKALRNLSGYVSENARPTQFAIWLGVLILVLATKTIGAPRGFALFGIALSFLARPTPFAARLTGGIGVFPRKTVGAPRGFALFRTARPLFPFRARLAGGLPFGIVVLSINTIFARS
tara:strand:- start:15 stop:395 length:381 start_codon:yes stop_codon:yes gene_type:complete